jgi:hypothetical protein
VHPSDRRAPGGFAADEQSQAEGEQPHRIPRTGEGEDVLEDDDVGGAVDVVDALVETLVDARVDGGVDRVGGMVAATGAGLGTGARGIAVVVVDDDVGAAAAW